MSIPKFLKTFVDTAKTIATTTSKKTAPGLPGSGQQRVAEGEITKREESNEGLFGGKPFLTRRQLRRSLEKAPAKIPGGGSFTKKERLSLGEEVFPKSKFGTHLMPYERNRRLRELKREIRSERNPIEKIKKRKWLRYFESLRGEEKKDGQ